MFFFSNTSVMGLSEGGGGAWIAFTVVINAASQEMCNVAEVV